MKAAFPYPILLVMVLLLGCNHKPAIALIDPYWLEIVGPERGKQIIRNAAQQENYEVTLVTPPANSPPPTVVELVKALDKPYAGIVLSPFYMGEVHTALRSAYPELPMAIVLGSPASMTEKTNLVDLDQTAVFRNAARTALRELEEKEGASLGVFLGGTVAREKNRAAFEQTWKIESGENHALDIIELPSTITPNGALTEIKNQLSLKNYHALLLLTGPLTPKLVPLLSDFSGRIGLENFKALPDTSPKPLFQIIIDWKGLYRKAFEVLEKSPASRHVFYQND